jgi:hypothetical protein
VGSSRLDSVEKLERAFITIEVGLIEPATKHITVALQWLLSLLSFESLVHMTDQAFSLESRKVASNE